MWLGLTVEEQLGTHMSLVMLVEQERSRCPGMELRVTHRSPGRMGQELQLGRNRGLGQELGTHFVDIEVKRSLEHYLTLQ